MSTDRAAGLLIFYMRRTWEAAGMDWDGDNSAEMESLADALVSDVIHRIGNDLHERISALEKRLDALEGQTPARLQAERELAETLADNAGWDYHGRDCNCPYCATDEDES
jgi:hypothetical protein